MTERNEQWREELRKTMSPKERVAIPRAAMNELDATYRSHSYDEVNQGLTEEQANGDGANVQPTRQPVIA